jgi:hypothetical protein
LFCFGELVIPIFQGKWSGVKEEDGYAADYRFEAKPQRSQEFCGDLRSEAKLQDGMRKHFVKQAYLKRAMFAGRRTSR